MKQATAAKRYATALLQVAQEQGKIAAFDSELQILVQALAENPALQAALASPVVASSQKKAILSALAPKLQISPSVGNLMHILIDNDRVSELFHLALVYRDLADESEGRVRVSVTSAFPLGEHEAKLKTLLQNSLKREILLEAKVDPEILGGLVVRVQDRVFNASLRGELDRWKNSLSSEAVA